MNPRVTPALTALALGALGLALGACPSDPAPADDATTPDGDDGDDGAEASDTSARPVVRVVSLNLRCLIDDWDARLPILADGLAALDPDVLGLQEVCEQRGVRDALTELVDALAARTGRTYAVHRSVTHRAWDTYDEGLAIVSALPLSDAAVVPLPAGTFPRKLLLARVSIPSDPSGPTGPTLVFGTTHLDHQSAASRKLQGAKVATSITDYAGADQPVTLTGDFNEGPTGGDVHATLAAIGLVDLWAALHPDDPGPTFPATAPTQRIDAIWLDAAGSGLVATEITRILTAAVDGVMASDHLGLIATLAP